MSQSFVRIVFFLCFVACYRLISGQTITICPSGRQPYLSNGVARTCTTTSNVITGCPSGSTCEYITTNTAPYSHLCCLTQTTSSQCSPNSQIYVNGQCVNYAQPNYPCSYSQQCTGGSTCTNGLCQCPASQLVTSSPYSRRQLVSYSCTYANGLPVGIIQVTCPYPQILIGNYCYPPVGPSGICTYSQQCFGGSQCIIGVCTCPYSYSNYLGQCVQQCTDSQHVFYNGGCYTTTGPGGSCQINNQCTGGSTCNNGVCNCVTGLVVNANGVCASPTVSAVACQATNQLLINGQCVSPVLAGQSCIYSQQCTGGSQCLSSICQCVGTSVNQGGTCIAAPTIACAPGTVPINGVCYTQAFPSDSCTFTAQCQAGSTCVSGFCSCPAGLVVSNRNCSPPAAQTQSNSASSSCRTSGSVPYTDPTTGSLRNCISSVCPSNYGCEYNYGYSQYICCSLNTSG